MNHTIHYSVCPVCENAGFTKVLSVKDHTVSQEVFDIVECTSCRLRFTQDIPSVEAIGPYYKSEQYISHTNTSKGFINRLYQLVRKKTIRSKVRLVQQQTGCSKGTLLDIGSGIGTFAKAMTDAGWQATALEPDGDARKTAADLYNLELRDSPALFQLPVSSFDAITMWHVLEHVHDLNNYVARLRLLLKDSGKLFIAVPNYTSRDAGFYKEHWAAYDVPRHLYHFSPASMRRLMEKHGLKIGAYKAMWYDSFYISLLSSKYKNGQTRLIGAGLQGLLSNLAAIGSAKKCSSVIYIISK